MGKQVTIEGLELDVTLEKTQGGRNGTYTIAGAGAEQLHRKLHQLCFNADELSTFADGKFTVTQSGLVTWGQEEDPAPDNTYTRTLASQFHAAAEGRPILPTRTVGPRSDATQSIGRS